MTRALGRSVRFQDVPFEVYRGLGFPGADDLGNHVSIPGDRGDDFLRARDVETSRKLNPELLSFDAWLDATAKCNPSGIDPARQWRPREVSATERFTADLLPKF